MVKTLSRKCTYQGETAKILVEKVHPVIDENGNDYSTVVMETVPADEYHKRLPKAVMYDLKQQLNAGVEMKEVAFNMGHTDPIAVETSNMEKAGALVNQFKNVESSATEETIPEAEQTTNE